MLSKLTPITTAVAARWQELTWPELTPGDVRNLAVVATFFVLFALEARFAYRKHVPRLIRQSYFTNLGSFILNDTLMSVLAVSTLWLVAERHAGFGLLSDISDPYAKGLASFVLLDLALYGWHWLNHHLDVLWMLHRVHHSDRCMNVSTAFRLHGGEIALTTLVKAAFIILTGIDSALLLANEAVITLFVMFHHTNIAFPGERWLARVIVVPALHRTHHSTRRAEHDRNYGAVLSLWDRLFGTLSVREPETLGIHQVPGQNLLDLVRFGLIWNLPPQPLALQAMIAEAAYFRAEKRGFAPGHEFDDWLTAEQEILARSDRLAADRVRLTMDCARSPATLARSVRDVVRAQAAACVAALMRDAMLVRRLLQVGMQRVVCCLGGCVVRASASGKRPRGAGRIRLCLLDR